MLIFWFQRFQDFFCELETPALNKRKFNYFQNLTRTIQLEIKNYFKIRIKLEAALN